MIEHPHGVGCGDVIGHCHAARVLLAEDGGSDPRPTKLVRPRLSLPVMSSLLASILIAVAFASLVGPLGWMARTSG